MTALDSLEPIKASNAAARKSVRFPHVFRRRLLAQKPVVLPELRTGKWPSTAQSSALLQ
jgi:hypothetical protein